MRETVIDQEGLAGMLDVVLSLEAEFAIELSETDLEKVRTPLDLLALLNVALKSPPAQADLEALLRKRITKFRGKETNASDLARDWGALFSHYNE